MSFLVVFIGGGAFDVALGYVFDGEVIDGLLLEGVHGLCDMKTDVTAEIGADDFGAGVFEEARNGVTDDASVEMTDMENFERIGVAEFADNRLTLICV